MRRISCRTASHRSISRHRLAMMVGLLAPLLAPGCGHKEKAQRSSVSKPPTVRVIQPEVRKIVRVVGQPSFVESYEHTSIYPKLVGYIENWNVDIGDKVKKGEVLATLFVPELVEDFGTKKATVKLDEERVSLALKVVEVAQADVKAAEARLAEAKAILDKYQSEVDRWDTEVKRLKHEVERSVVDPQILLESTNQWRSSIAARDAAKAIILKAEAELLSRKAALDKAEVDVSVARADLAVAISEEKRIGAWVGYIKLPAPFDGIIMERTANTGDFVMPAMGDPSAMPRIPHLAPGGTAAPIYVVDRLDVVRIFADIPEKDADYVHGSDLRLMPSVKDIGELPTAGRDLIVLARVRNVLHVRIFNSDGKRVVDTDEHRLSQKAALVAALESVLRNMWADPRIFPLDKDRVINALTAIFGPGCVPVGTKASVLVQAYRDEPIPSTVTRTSWALNPKSRTLRAEIDLPNPGSQLLPGMYAYARVTIERPGVRALPVTALTYSGDKTCCWTYKDGHAERAEIHTGVSDGEWMEVTNLYHPEVPKEANPWVPINGSEQVILGDLSILADGTSVEIAPKTAGEKLTDDVPPSRQANRPSARIEAKEWTSPRVAAAGRAATSPPARKPAR
jgi:multidrug efflux pump subunit AcrA (membrane-fusion protein)